MQSKRNGTGKPGEALQTGLEDLGYGPPQEEYRKKKGFEPGGIGRIVAGHRERYVARTASGEYDAEVTGNFRFTARERTEFPVVGDWVSMRFYDEDRAVIDGIFPRITKIERLAAGKEGEKQILAANVDFAFLTQAVDRDFNPNRLERYLAICHESGVGPLVLLSKADLVDEPSLSRIVDHLKHRLQSVQILAISNKSRTGYGELLRLIERGRTYCLLGSSGAGKSTLVNNLKDREVMRTGSLSDSSKKGRHTTSHRELFVLENGGILIDNPGLREVGIADAEGGLQMTFADITGLSGLCRFRDCTHRNESGCAVIEAVEKGEIDRAVYENYLKMEKERKHFESSVQEIRRKDREFGRMVRRYKKDRNQNRD